MKLLLTATARSANDIRDKQSNDQQLTNQADFEILQSKYAEVRTLSQASPTNSGKTLGEDHPYVADTLNNLTLVCLEQRKYGEAAKLDERAKFLFSIID